MTQLRVFLTLLVLLGVLFGQYAAQQDPICSQPMEPGPCRMSLDRFYYNSKSNTCEPFKFGGCRGNDNKFGFLKTCQDACVVQTSAKPIK